MKKTETTKKSNSAKSTTKKTSKKVETTKVVNKKAPAKKMPVKKATENKPVKVENSKTLYTQEMVSGNEFKKLGIIIAIIVGVFCLFYVITKFVYKKDYSNIFAADDLTVSEIQYTDILISNLLTQKENTYYVLIEDSTNEYNQLLDATVQSYISSSHTAKLYTANLNNAFNKRFKGDSVSYVSDNLKFTTTTIIKVVDGVISEAYATYEEISSVLDGLV